MWGLCDLDKVRQAKNTMLAHDEWYSYGYLTIALKL